MRAEVQKCFDTDLTLCHPGMELSKEKSPGQWQGLEYSGAENGTRTRDLRLGRPSLYQLSYFRATEE